MTRILAALVVLLVAATAHAQAPGATPASSTEVEHYGGSIMLADAASLAVVGIGVGTVNEYVAGAGAIGVLLAGPAVHVAHGNYTAALGSFGLRAGLVIVGAFAGSELGQVGCDDYEDGCLGPQIGGAAIGGLVGELTASVLDARLLATARHERRERSSMVPTFAASGDRISVGLAGGF